MAKRTKEQLAKKLQAWIKKQGGPTASLSSIRPNPNNPRTITEDALYKLCCQLADMPQTLQARCIVYDEQGIILGGNMRHAALGELGIDQVPENWLYCAKGLSEEEKEQFILVDNTGAGQWNWDTLANEWDSDLIAEWGPVVPGWDVSAGEDEEQHLEAAEDDYDVPDGGLATDIILGDLFEIGEHRLLCGDSTDSDAVENLLAGAKADMVFTDPPYNVNYGADNTSHPSLNSKRDATIKNDNMTSKEFVDFIRQAFGNVKLYCDGVIYCFGAQGKDGRTMFTVLDEMFHNSGTIIWVKDSLVLGRSKYHNKYEPCWFGWNKSGETFTEDRTLTNVWEMKRPKKSDLHPTMKPIEIIEMAIVHNPKAKSILDPFLGSGSTMVAAHQLNRKCYGMEIEPKYCQVILDRMLKLDPSLSIKRNGKPYKPTQP